MKYIKILIVTFLVVLLFVCVVGCSSLHDLTDLTGITSYQQDADDAEEIALLNRVIKQRDDYDAAEKKCFLYTRGYFKTKYPDDQVKFRNAYRLPSTMPDEYKGLDCDWYLKTHPMS